MTTGRLSINSYGRFELDLNARIDFARRPDRYLVWRVD